MSIFSIFLPHALRHLRTSKMFLYHVNIYLKATFAFGDYENKIFSILSSERVWSNVILAGKRDSRRYLIYCGF